jgi:hypothetical protein
MRFDRSGIALELPPGWDVAVHRREERPVEARGGAPLSEQVLASTAPEATTHPVLHAGSFALPPDRGDYGSGAVDVMTATDVLVVLVEFHPDAARTPLFAAPGPPRALTSDSFGAQSLQRVIDGQSGYQRFFSAGGRAFSLYVVLGSHARRHLLVPVVNQLLETIDIRPAGDS